MRKIIINGGKKLQGEVTVSGAKNSVVALIPAIILSDGVVTLDGVPAISDVDNLIEIIEVMGGSVKRDGETLEIDLEALKICQCHLVRLTAFVLHIISMVVCLGVMVKL